MTFSFLGTQPYSCLSREDVEDARQRERAEARQLEGGFIQKDVKRDTGCFILNSENMFDVRTNGGALGTAQRQMKLGHVNT